jgi:hypothetical protein
MLFGEKPAIETSKRMGIRQDGMGKEYLKPHHRQQELIAERAAGN